MAKAWIFAVFVAVLVAHAQCDDVKPSVLPMWGGALEWESEVDFHAEYNKNWTFSYHYMTNEQGSFSRYVHAANQYDEICAYNPKAPNRGENTPCTVTFATDGWSYLQYPANDYCCKCREDFGAIRYNWLDRCQAKYRGMVNIDGEKVPSWVCQGQFDNNYAARPNTFEPMRFWEHKHQWLKAWHFKHNTYKRVAQDPSYFEPIEGCTELCPSGPCMAGRPH